MSAWFLISIVRECDFELVEYSHYSPDWLSFVPKQKKTLSWESVSQWW